MRQAVDAHTAHGTTTMLASLVTRPVPVLVEQVATLADLVTDGLIAGIHLEGPFLSAARCGAHDPGLLRPPDPVSVDALLAAGRGTIRMVTVAPELEGAVPAVKRLVDAGVIAAIGHTDALAEDVVPAVDAGATVATHLFNGMRPLHHREPGPIGVLLDDERVTVELICDLVHLHPTIVRLAARHAGVGRTVLITDAIDGGRGGRRKVRHRRARGGRDQRRPDARGRRFTGRQHADHGPRVPQPGEELRARRARRGGRRRPPARRNCWVLAT